MIKDNNEFTATTWEDKSVSQGTLLGSKTLALTCMEIQCPKIWESISHILAYPFPKLSDLQKPYILNVTESRENACALKNI